MPFRPARPSNLQQRKLAMAIERNQKKDAELNSPPRRIFLRKGGLLAAAGLSGVGSAAVAEGSNNLPPYTPSWTSSQGRPSLDPAYGQPSRFESHVARRLREGTVVDFPTTVSTMTPLQSLYGTLIPNGLGFERHHAGIPNIDPDQHRLLVHGLVKKALSFTMDDLVRFPSVSRVHFLECSGNTLTEWKALRHLNVQSTHGLLSCCEWTGVPLGVVLQEAGLLPDAKWLLAEGADAAAMTRSIPLEKAMEDALLVYAQNGEMLRPEHGYPLRLFLPGYEGNMSIKWLRRLKLGAEPFQTREETSKYTDLMPDGQARQFTFLMDVKSVITFPSGGQALKRPGFYEISGLAWSGRGRIRRVEVSVDSGRTWSNAILQEPVLSRSLTRFRLPWRWQGEPTVLQSRATDETGDVQPTRAQLIAVRGTNSIYHYNGIQSWQVSESGDIRNVHA